MKNDLNRKGTAAKAAPTVEPASEPANTGQLPKPEFFPIPSQGGGRDPYFGCSRSFWYSLEKFGLLKLTRLKIGPKQKKPKVLIPFAEAQAAFRKLSTASTTTGGAA